MWDIFKDLALALAAFLGYRKTAQDQAAGAAENETAQLKSTVEIQQAELSAGTVAAAGNLDDSLHNGTF